MSQLLAILQDSFREAADRRSLLVLLLLSVLVIVFCASMSFKPVESDALLRAHLEDLSVFRRRGYMGGSSMSSTTLASRVERVERLPDGGATADVSFAEERQLDHVVNSWEEFQRQAPPGPRTEEPVSEADRRAFFEERLSNEGWESVEVTRLEQDVPKYRISVRGDPMQVTGPHEMSFLFGAWTTTTDDTSIAGAVVMTELGIADTLVGSIGILIAVLTCAGFVPDMLRRGSLDLVLARPIGRVRLLLYKYVGGLWFVTILGSVLIGGSWLALVIRTGYASPWYLVTVFVAVAVFAVIYSVVVLIAVLTGSSTIAALVAIGVWWFSALIVQFHHGFSMARGPSGPEWLENAFAAAYTVLPKTSDLGLLSQSLLTRSQLSPGAYAATFKEVMPDVDWFFSLGTTGLFTGAMLALACWAFARRDY